MIDFVAATDRETRRLLDVARDTDLEAAVPSCPDWKVADLVWHMAEVQWFWGTVVGERLQDTDSYERPHRPPDLEVVGFLDTCRRRLVTALEATPPETPLYTWHEADRSAGFVARRQAHEALIHRVDAELAAGTLTPLDPELAADGVDEVIGVMLTGVPGWASFTPDGHRIRLAVEGGRSWDLEFGRFTGTSPDTGNTYDLDACDYAPDDGADPDAVVSGSAEDLDLWLWGRGPVGPLTVTGHAELADRLREQCVEVMQ